MEVQPAELAITITGVGTGAVNDTDTVAENGSLNRNAAAGVLDNDNDDTTKDSENLIVTGSPQTAPETWQCYSRRT